MTYTYTKPASPSVALQKRIHEARQRAADIAAQVELKRIEEANAEAEAGLEAAKEHHMRTLADIKRRRDEAARYPVDPEWRRHRAEMVANVKAFEAERVCNARETHKTAPRTGLQVVTDIVAPRTDSRPSQDRTTLRAVS